MAYSLAWGLGTTGIGVILAGMAAAGAGIAAGIGTTGAGVAFTEAGIGTAGEAGDSRMRDSGMAAGSTAAVDSVAEAATADIANQKLTLILQQDMGTAGHLRMPFGIEKWNKNLPRPPSEIEAIAENHFGDQMVCGMGHSHAEAEIDFPIRRKIKVDRREDLVLLLAGGKKIRGRAHCAVVLESPGDFFREIIAELEVRREDHSLMDAAAMEGTVERGINRPVPRP